MTDSCFRRTSRRPTSTSRNNTDPRGHSRSICGRSPIARGGITEIEFVRPTIPLKDRGARNMTQSDERDAQSAVQDVALIVGGGPGISSSCARLFTENGMSVAVAARNPEKPVLQNLEKTHGVHRYACDAS